MKNLLSHPQSTIKTMFSSSLRSGALRQWEPIFIGTKKDPTYDPRLTWEGRADKMVIFIHFIEKIYLSAFCCTLWDAILASYLAFFQAKSSVCSRLLSFVLDRSYIMWLEKVVGECISVNVLNLHLHSHRFDFHCYLAGWRSEDVPQKVFVFYHSTILNYYAYTAIWCISHTFWVRRLYDFVLLLASKYIFSWSVYILFIFETFTFLLSYEFNVLDNAFLVHAPGFKTTQERDRQMKPAKVTIV